MDSEVQQLLSRARYLVFEFMQREQTQHIHEAINLDREALERCPPGGAKRSVVLNQFAVHLYDRYSHLGMMADLEEAIVLSQGALALCPPGHFLRTTFLNNLANHLADRFRQFGSTQDLDEAIVLGREALDLRPLGHSLRSTSLSNLSSYLSDRYNLLGSMQDLEEAIVCAREALDLRPPGHSLRSTSLNNLANRLSDRYNLLGSMQDLDQAIVLVREALNLCPLGHSVRSISLSNLANRLFDRYNQLRSMQDSDEAIALAREALKLHPPGHSLRRASMMNLAIFLSDRYNLLGSMQDLEEAIVLGRGALELSPPGHPRRSTSLNNLAKFLSDRYSLLRSVQDLGEAIALGREALDLCPPGHPRRSTSLNNLANRLSDRYDQFGFTQDLDEAIVLGRETLGLCPQGHPYRSQPLANIAVFLYQRFTRSVQLTDKEELFSLYSQLVHVDQFVPSSHISVTRAWIRMAESFQHPTLLLAYETSLRLLIHHLATLPSLPQHLSILKQHTSSLAVDAFSACLRNRSPVLAVELLEQGRSVFWSQLTRLHSPLDDVRTSGPAGEKFADEFTRLASRIRNALNSPDADQHERVYRLNVEMQSVVADIRKLSGLSRFLLPSFFSDLQQAARGGPIIIVNANRHSCDALIVLLDQDPVHIPLQITQEHVQGLSAELYRLTQRAKRFEMAREFAIFLRQLWDQIASPIVHFLQTIVPPRSRIWWCPTGDFCGLPLHAAGPFRRGQQNLPALYISSYTSTLTALIRARQRDPLYPATERKRFIAIGQANADGESELHSVAKELDMIGQGVDGLAAFTRIDGDDACISRVIEEFEKSEWIHFACHGLPNPERPFESAFALRDGHFTIQKIIGCEIKNPEFAYLSACHTTVGDEESPDEMIHLASAMQFVGFCSVIGTMWAVDDEETKKITPTFYRYMVDESGRLDYTRAAYALNRTMRSVNIPLDQQILYIHLGA